MSKFTDLIQDFAKSGAPVQIVVPGVGRVIGKVESFQDDLVVIAREGQPKTVIHYTQFIVESE